MPYGLIGGPWEFDLHRLSINGVGKQQFSFVEACKMSLHVLCNETVGGVSQFG
jgi:hypothetical protein